MIKGKMKIWTSCRGCKALSRDVMGKIVPEYCAFGTKIKGGCNVVRCEPLKTWERYFEVNKMKRGNHE